ncbi:helix-turn-helix transcriptional regulator [Glutamicibacter creatinolyticus]|uniref:helix-turn-helix transcriptional regulator n=1 Tax=Glutamicibacter creatinolyticus TaxID=162496 RepID=UPI003217308C
MTLGNDIRRLRREQGLTQEALAQRSDVSRPTIARLETGSAVSTVTLLKLAKALDYRLDWAPRKEVVTHSPSRQMRGQ